MAGVVIEVRVKEGQHVNAGDPLVVLSAMKMESVVSSPVSGLIGRVPVNVSDSIAQGDLVVEIHKTEHAAGPRGTFDLV